MTPTEALAIVQEVCNSTKNDVVTPLLERLRDAFPNTPFIDLIYHRSVELTPQQVVDEAFKCEADHAGERGKP
jgi:hypothetical protein